MKLRVTQRRTTTDGAEPAAERRPLLTRVTLVTLPSTWAVVAAASLTVVLAGSAVAVAVHSTGLPGNAAFSYDGKVTTAAQLDDRVQILGALYGVVEPTSGSQRALFLRTAAKSMAVSDLLDKQAAAHAIVISDKTASDKLNQIVAQSDPSGLDDFIQKLGALGLSEKQVVTEIKRQLANSQLYSQITRSAAPVTDAVATTYYNAHKSQIVTPEKRHLLNIVVSSEATAGSILAKARSGSDFAALAKADTLDLSTKSKGGDLGTLSAAQLESGYAAQAFAAPAGGLFGPVKTAYGWNVGKVVAITPAVQLTLAQSMSELKSELLQNEQTVIWNKWLGDKLAGAGIRYAARYRPADPDAPPTDAATP